MNSSKSRTTLILIVGALVAILVLAMGCASAEPTATPASPAQPAAPTTAPQPTVVVIPGAPTPIPAKATPTRVLPTATPIAASAINYGGILRQARTLDMQVLSPLHSKSPGEQDPVFAIFDSLTFMQPDFEVTPGLGQSWETSNGGKDITFQLAQGVKFHDGTDFTASDVKWIIDKVMDPDFFSTSKGFFDPAIESVEVVSDYVVTLHLKKPWRPLLANMATSKFGFVSPESIEKHGDDYGRYPSGTGPYKLKEWTPGNRIVMERNEDFWDTDFYPGGRPYLAEIWIQDIPDRTVQLAMLRTSETDIVDTVSGTELYLIENNPIIKTVPFETRNWWSMFLQVKEPPFDNLALRQAIFYSLDRQKIIDVHLAGEGTPAYSNGNFWYIDPNYEPYKYNPQKAKEKLIEAGYPNGVTIPYWCSSADVELRLCEIIQAMLSETGITAEITIVPASDYYKNINSGGCAFCKMAYFPRPDPDYVMRSTLHYQGFRGRNVHGTEGVSNYPEVDRLIDEAAGIYDTVKAGELYIEAQKIIFDDAAYTGLYYPTTYAAMNTKVNGFQWWTDSRLRYRPMWIEN